MGEFPYLDAALDGDWGEALRGEVNPLRAELDACQAPWAVAKALREMGVPAATIAELSGAGDLGHAGVDLYQQGSRFAVGGPDRRLLVGVRDEFGALVDVVALASSDENEWALRTGDGLLLGHPWLAAIEDAVEREYVEADVAARKPRPFRVRLFSTPMGWLRGGGDGLCVVNWDCGAVTVLRSLGSAVTLVVEPGAKPRLDAMLAHGGLPLVAEAQTVRRAA